MFCYVAGFLDDISVYFCNNYDDNNNNNYYYYYISSELFGHPDYCKFIFHLFS